MDTNLSEERRKQQRLEALGDPNPRCVICGEQAWSCLEKHHLQQERYGGDFVILCRNCHRRLTDQQKDHPEPLTQESPPILEQIGHFLLGLANLLAMLAERVREFGLSLLDAVAFSQRPYGLLDGGAV